MSYFNNRIPFYYSVHTFMIWNGKAMKSTPEFQSYRRTYNTGTNPVLIQEMFIASCLSNLSQNKIQVICKPYITYRMGCNLEHY